MAAGQGLEEPIDGPVGIVTGASRGLGRALTHALSERGWRLGVDARGAGAREGAVASLRRRGTATR